MRASLILIFYAIGSLSVSAQYTSRLEEQIPDTHATFSSEGIEKARGLNFRIAYPKDWEALSTDTPNTLVILQPKGKPLDGMSLQVRQLPRLMSRNEAREIAKDSAGFADDLAATGMTILGHRSVEIMACAAVEITTAKKMKTASAEANVICIYYQIPYRDKLFVAIGFIQVDRDGVDGLKDPKYTAGAAKVKTLIDTLIFRTEWSG